MNAEHLATLEEVLKRLKEQGIRIKNPKCKFLQPSVEYLGHIVDKQGLHATPDQVKAVVDAPSPKDVEHS